MTARIAAALLPVAQQSSMQEQQQQQSKQTTMALLLMDPHSNRFELVQLHNIDACETMSDTTNNGITIEQIPYMATHERFRSLKYKGIIGGSSQVRVALPHGMLTSACIRWARSILTTDPVHSMLTANGFDLQEWYSLQPDTLVVLLDLASKRFELVVMDHDVQTVQECLEQIPLRARDPFLKQQQEYIGLCDLMATENTLANTNNNGRMLSSSQVWVAIPKHKTAQECATLARSILATQAVVRTLHSHGFHVPSVPSLFSNAVVLLLDPNKTRRMECLRLDGLSCSASPTVADVVHYIQTTARERALREQSYVALCNAAGHVATSSLHVSESSRMWVAVPLGISVRKCRAMARSIYNSSPVQQMLQQNGLDANEWRM